MGETTRQDTRTWLTGSEFERIYGPVQPWSPAQAAEILDGVGMPWWVAGGWAIEAFTGVGRPHEDIDLSVFRRDLPMLRRHLEPHFHLWAASDEGLLHLPPGRAVPDRAEQVWVREHSLAPWSCEFLLNRDVDGRWQSKRDPSFSAPLEAVTWERDGIRYLAPELVLSHKVATGRPKDDDDLEAALPLLSAEQRGFLVRFVETHAPDHPWRARIDAAAS
jgi:hypothetical protein